MKPAGKNKELPVFRTEDEEREFWANADASDYFDWTNAVTNPEMPNLKPSITTISIRLPQHLIHELKMIAHKKDIPYQSLMKQYLFDKVKEEHAPYTKRKKG